MTAAFKVGLVQVFAMAMQFSFWPLGLDAQEGLAGFWKGTIERQGSGWPAELRLDRQGETWTARLSLPQLGYFDVEQPVSAVEADRATVEFPFGLGLTQLKLSGSSLTGPALNGNEKAAFAFAFSRGESPALATQPFQFVSHGTAFSGRRIGPVEKEQTRGTLLLLHGSAQSGPESWSYRGYATLLARMGHEVFLYERRSGERAPDLEQLVADAKAAFAAIRTLPGRETVRVGLVGGSQAGWIAAALAAECPELVALVAITGWPAVTPGEQELQRIRHEFLADGYGAAEIEAAAAYFGFYLYAARHDELWPQLESAAKHVLEQKWGDFVETPRQKSDLRWWAVNQDFPAWDHLPKIACPVFAAYGANDCVVPPSANAQLLHQLVSSGSNRAMTFKVYHEADHRIELPAGDTPAGFRWPQLSPDFLRDLEDWLKLHTPQR